MDALSLLLEDVDSLQLNIEINLSQILQLQTSVHNDNLDAPSTIGSSEHLEFGSEIGHLVEDLDRECQGIQTPPRTASVDIRVHNDDIRSESAFGLDSEGDCQVFVVALMLK
jgi:hypothetical protein